MAKHSAAACRVITRALGSVVALAFLSLQAHADIVIHKFVDKASPSLFLDGGGRHAPSTPPPPPPPPPPVGPPPALTMPQHNLTISPHSLGLNLRIR